MHRHVLSRAFVALVAMATSSCFYAPEVADCAVACPNEACPQGLSCQNGFCSRSVACECQLGSTRACGTDVGECTAGTQRCEAGAWGVCEGEVAPSADVCDGRDNDCDGYVDGTAPEARLETSTPGSRLDGWRVLGFDGGYVVVTRELDGTDAGTTLVHFFDGTFARLDGLSLGAYPPGEVEVVARSGRLYVAQSELDAGVLIRAIANRSVVWTHDLADAGFGARLNVGIDDQRLVLHWDTTGDRVTRLAKVPLDGSDSQLVDLQAVMDAGYDGGIAFVDAYSAALSNGGRYAVFTAAAPVGSGLNDPVKFVVDTDKFDAIRPDAPYYQTTTNRKAPAQLFELPNRTVPLIYAYPIDGFSGVYFNADLLRLSTSDEYAVADSSDALSFPECDGVVDGEGRISFVFHDVVQETVTLARSADAGVMRPPVKRVLERDGGFGVARLAFSGTDERLGLVIEEANGLTFRHVCPVR